MGCGHEEVVESSRFGGHDRCFAWCLQQFGRFVGIDNRVGEHPIRTDGSIYDVHYVDIDECAGHDEHLDHGVRIDHNNDISGRSSSEGRFSRPVRRVLDMSPIAEKLRSRCSYGIGWGGESHVDEDGE